MKMKNYVVVESFDITEKTIVEAESKEDAEQIIRNDDDHSGDIIDCYETTATIQKPQAKRFVGIFKVYNGEFTYTIPVKTEAETLEQATEFFEQYKYPTNFESWDLRYVKEVTDNFNELWKCI